MPTFERYVSYPNEELALQRQMQLLHPMIIALKRKQVGLALKMLEYIQSEIKNSNILVSKINLDIRDENRNTILHHAFSLFQDESLRP
jgi:hypothetical protein